MTGKHAAELARLLRIYLPAGPARQLAGDLMRSDAAKDERTSFAEAMTGAWNALRGDVDGTARDYAPQRKGATDAESDDGHGRAD